MYYVYVLRICIAYMYYVYVLRICTVCHSELAKNLYVKTLRKLRVTNETIFNLNDYYNWGHLLFWETSQISVCRLISRSGQSTLKNQRDLSIGNVNNAKFMDKVLIFFKFFIKYAPKYIHFL